MPSTPYLDAVAVILRNVESTTGLGAAYHDVAAPESRRTNRALCDFCRACFDRPDTAALCRISCLNAATQSLASGDAFYYTCWAGLVFVTLAIAPRRTLRGGIAIGGFCAPGDEVSLRQILPDRLPPSLRNERRFFADQLQSIRPIGPGALRGLGPFLLEASFSSGLNAESDFRRQADRYAQQRAIAEAAAILKKRPLPRLPIRAEALVAAWAGRAPLATVRRQTATYLAALLQHCAWDLLRFKAHLRVLTAMVTRERILKNKAWTQSAQSEGLLLSRLEQAADIDEACALATEWLAGLRSRPAAGGPAEQRPLTERVTRWIQDHYREKVRLSGVARAVGASVSAIVQHLRRETGKSFHRILIEIRVAEVKRLLATTDLEISAIAALCGFADQSHLTRLLQREINLTPGQFRRLLTLPHLDAASGSGP